MPTNVGITSSGVVEESVAPTSSKMTSTASKATVQTRLSFQIVRVIELSDVRLKKKDYRSFPFSFLRKKGTSLNFPQELQEPIKFVLSWEKNFLLFLWTLFCLTDPHFLLLHSFRTAPAVKDVQVLVWLWFFLHQNLQEVRFPDLRPMLSRSRHWRWEVPRQLRSKVLWLARPSERSEENPTAGVPSSFPFRCAMNLPWSSE